MKRDDIIRISKENHDIEYDYSLVKDSKLASNIDVICLKHGIFHPRLSRFLKGSNCPFCVKKGKKTKEEFIEESNKIHNNFYTYENFNYVNSHTKSYITCPIHGDFLQNPTNHLSGNGCPICKKEKLHKQFSSNKEEFIKKAQIIHNGKYSYDNFIYVNNSTKSKITCPIHGDFLQSPKNHLQGKGCSLCKVSHLEKEIINFFTELKIDFTYEQKFDWLGKKSLDFYLEKYNIAIECQGSQHFENCFSDNFDLNKVIQRDIEKFNLCKQHNIKIFYYLYDEIDFSNEKYQNIYSQSNVLYNINDISNILKINVIKQDIINLLSQYNISYKDNINNIQINNLIIYPINNISCFKNIKNKNYFNEISINNEKKGLRTIWIKPYEWFNENKKKILTSFILSACGVIIHRIYARNCYIKVLTNQDTINFFNENSMYGYRPASIILGLFNKKEEKDIPKDTLLMSYTIGSAFYGKGKYDIEVIRASTKCFCQVIGGASKLWNYFLINYPIVKINNKEINWNTCCYYVDFDHNNGNSLTYLGFKFDHYTEGGFHLIGNDNLQKINRQPMKHKKIMEDIKNGKLAVVNTAGTKVFVYKKDA